VVTVGAIAEIVNVADLVANEDQDPEIETGREIEGKTCSYPLWDAFENGTRGCFISVLHLELS